MSAREEARAHLRKAQQFLDSAIDLRDRAQWDVATSNAVTAGINAADTVLLVLTGRSAKTGDHADAVRALEAAGGLAKPMVSPLKRLLKHKNRAQYQVAPMSRSVARSAVGGAEQLCSMARDILTER